MNMKKSSLLKSNISRIPLGNKKGLLSYYVAMFIIKIILLAIVITFVCLTIFILVAGDVGVENIRAELFLERSLTAPDCFSYNDENGRSYPSVIDYEKFIAKEGFESLTLHKCMDYGRSRNFTSAEFVLFSMGNEKEIGKVYFNKYSFDRWLPFTFDKRYLSFNGYRYVIIKEGMKSYPGKIAYTIVTPSG